MNGKKRVFEFIEAVLTLTPALMSVPSDTSALSDYASMPTKVSTVSLYSHTAKLQVEENKNPFSFFELKRDKDPYANWSLKSRSTQAI